MVSELSPDSLRLKVTSETLNQSDLQDCPRYGSNRRRNRRACRKLRRRGQARSSRFLLSIRLASDISTHGEAGVLCVGPYVNGYARIHAYIWVSIYGRIYVRTYAESPCPHMFSGPDQHEMPHAAEGALAASALFLMRM